MTILGSMPLTSLLVRAHTLAATQPVAQLASVFIHHGQTLAAAPPVGQCALADALKPAATTISGNIVGLAGFGAPMVVVLLVVALFLAPAGKAKPLLAAAGIVVLLMILIGVTPQIVSAITPAGC